MHLNEPLNKVKIESILNTDSKAYLTRLEVHSSIDSTNDYLLAYAKNTLDAKSGVVCLAEEQTKGRGRQGKEWFSPKGNNIYCSLLWHVSAEIDLSQLSLAVAVIVTKALKRYGVSTGLQLKWPNDIYFAQRKLAGILIETLPVRNQFVPIVIGLGLNLQLPTNHPLANTAIDIVEVTGVPAKRNQLAGLIIHELLINLPVYAQLGFAPFLAEWQQLDFLRGKLVIVQAPQLTMTGYAEGINEKGELVLRDESGNRKWFRCGEVSVKV